MPRVLFLLLPALVLLGGCERPFIEPAAPTIEVVSPEDLALVRSQSQLPLAFRVDLSFGAVDRVEVNGVRATFSTDEVLYLDTLQLSEGVNRVVVEAFGDAGTVGGDTLFALYLPARFTESAALLPDGLGGHAATRLQDGRVLFTGGAASATAPAQDLALLFDPGSFSFDVLPNRMVEARVGHAASLLPDGRVLLTGGSRRVVPTEVDTLVTTVELFDPATGTFSAVPVVADDEGEVTPVQRTEHTVTVLQRSDGRTTVFLYGGLGNLGGPIDPVFGPLPFMRQLQLEDSPAGPRLVAPNRSEGFRFTAIARHTQTPLTNVGPDGFGRYLIAGASPPEDPNLAAPFELLFAPSQLDDLPAGPLVEPRLDHAAAPIRPGLVLVTGGRAPDGATIRATGEVFADEAGVFFQFAGDVRLAVPRWGHTATNLGDGRILIVGGFSASGQALPQTELFIDAP